MDSFEMSKIAGAVLTALLLIFGTKTLIEARQPGAPAKPGYTLPAATAADGAAASAAPAGDAGKTAEGAAAPAAKADGAAPAAGAAWEAVLAALPKASADNGKALFAKCKACHSAEKGKPKGVGPNLWGVVNRAKGTGEGFEYSPGMKAKGGNWTFEDLAHFITNPKGFVSGTKMVFSGLPAADAADVIAYLSAQSDTPAELPK